MNDKELIKRKETDLEIADFLWEILRRWRLLLVCMLAGAVLLSGLQLIKDVKTAKATPEQIQVEEEKTVADLESALGEQDIDAVLGATAMKKQLDEKSQYVKESELMQINPYEENVIYLQYCVLGDLADMDYADFFEQHILNGTNASELVDLVADGQLIYTSNDGALINEGSKTGDNKNGFIVRVRGLSEEACRESAESVKADLEQYALNLSAEFSGLSLTLLEETIAIVVDTELAALQNQTATMLKVLNTNLDSLKSNMTGDQLALYVKYTENTQQEQSKDTDQMETGEVAVEVSSSTVHFNSLRFLIGVVIGFVLAVVWILLAFACSSKLRSEREVQSLYHVNVLGNIRLGKENPIDRMILSARYHKAATLTLEEEIRLICANIKVACKNENTVYLSGSVIDAMPEELVTQIVEECNDRGITVVAGNELSYHADALEKLAEVGRVVFIEQLRDSYYDEVYKEVKTCIEHKIPVVGMIIVGV
jgi:hypothetical protein